MTSNKWLFMTQIDASRRKFIHYGAAGLTVLGGASPSSPAFAQATLEQIRILCGFAPGAAPDVVARAVASQLSASFPRGVVVDNRPGAGGQIAVSALKAAPGDGSILLAAPGSSASVYPYLFAKAPYDPLLDLKPVSLGAESSLWLAVGPAVPASVANVRDFFEWIRRNPKLANVGSPGLGTPPHLLQAMLLREGGVPWEHIAFPGGPPAVTALLGGHIASLALAEAPLRGHVAAGKLRVLATSGTRRSPLTPDVATLVEQGFPNMAITDWFGFFAPSGTSASVVEALSEKVRAVIKLPALVSHLAEAGMVAVSSTPADMAKRIAADRLYWEPVIRNNNIRID
jgi:tripartite-type tricarboxylate transporter receptor subunit TctC